MLTPILVSLVLSFFFSGIESAFLASNKLHIELQRKQGRLVGQVLSIFVKNPSQFLSTMLVGNTLALVFYGYHMAAFLKGVLEGSPVLSTHPILLLITQSLLSATVVLFTAEFIPKTLFMIKPNYFLAWFAWPALIVYYLLFFVVKIVVFFSKHFIELVLRLPYGEKKNIFRLADLGEYVRKLAPAGKQKEEEIDARILNNALDFKRVRVRDCMVPRPEIVAIEEKAERKTLQQAFLKHGHSRILLYKGSIDNITGYCHVLSLLEDSTAENNQLPKIRPLPITTETNAANALLIEMLREGQGVALVVDEYGGTAGIVTLEDIIEEIFGEINDEYDHDHLMAKRIGTNAYLFSARLEVDYLNEQYNLVLPTGEYDTLGGLVLSINEELPEINETLQVGTYLLRIVSKEEHRIDKIELRINDKQQTDSNNHYTALNI